VGLDSIAEVPSSLLMRVSLLVLLMTLVVTRVTAQERDLVTLANPTNSQAIQIQARLASLLEAETPTNKAGLSLGKKLHVDGPLVSGFGARKILEVPRRILHFINPFAPAEHSETFEKTAQVNPRAWATTVGLRPGASAFADATTHEPSMTLLSVGQSAD